MKLSKVLFTIIALAVILTVPVLAENRIKVGVTPGEHEEIMEQVAKIAAEKGLAIDIVSFTDYVMPNQALDDGDLDANSFQHAPYLDRQTKDRGYDLSVVGYTIVTPMGLYSDKYKSLDALPDGAQIAIPNDPTNGGRALLLLQSKGLIRLDAGSGLVPGPLDVVDNPKAFRFIELDAAQLPRALADVDAAAINTNYASEAGLDPARDSIAIESAGNNPYANVIVTRGKDSKADWVKILVDSYHCDTIRDFINKRYGGAVLPAF
ncbi:MAG: MetQ/NlpA family ABC transporter substrate-binding protein [Hyphomicrobiales bacterium]